MTRFLRFACVGVAVAGLASVANAQICAGTPSFSVGGGRIGGSALASGNSSKAYGANAALGAHNGFYVTGNFTHATADNGGSSNGGGGALSYEWPKVFGDMVHVCSTVGAYTQEGSLVGELPVNPPQNTFDLHFGGSLGWVASSSSSMDVIPSIGGALIARSNTFKIQYQGQSNAARNYNFGMVTGTIGFVFNKRCTISPVVEIPISEYQGKPSYGVAVSYNFNLPKGMHM